MEKVLQRLACKILGGIAAAVLQGHPMKLWSIAWDMWEHRNGILHDKRESCYSLHDLQLECYCLEGIY